MHPRGTVEVRVVPVGIKLKKGAVDRAAPRSVSDVRKVLRSPQWFRQPWQDGQGRETQKYCDVRDQIELGAGEAVYDAARAALRRWQQLRLGWVDVWSPDTPLEVGQVVAIMGWAAGFWWLNACRIAYTTDESGPTSKFGFAYGTLPGHVECGEERFLIEWDRITNQVSYDILAFSKPNHMLTRVGYPLVRRSQKRFGRDSAISMFRAANATSSPCEVIQNTG